MPKQDSSDPATAVEKTDLIESEKDVPPAREYGGPKGKEPTRYGDWEKNGRCVDF